MGRYSRGIDHYDDRDDGTTNPFRIRLRLLKVTKDFVEFLRWELYMRNSELIDRSPIRPSAESGSSANPEYPATGPDTRG
ncbi:hypothetical protein PGT21_012034 [Puccinia graminis f. sp. tritici]|uniref:Uncharacterized protein n=1 Tax=Puccinia graminis f. sp. tritici TaxID=56615 RepID=A0A5B0P5Q1_PUCGR|nr:hypothetical protein PGT21_000501 [Puccinia graminis f. sp. tritici]KAA1112825.1 hypothetical protein PGT21_012034 [Puccinia graminis f. sp. tritici]